MSRIKTGHFTPDGSTDIAIPIGFVPHWLRIDEVGNATNTNTIVWYKDQENDVTGDQAGSYLTGSTGEVTQLSDDAGVAAYSTKSEYPTVTSYTVAVSTAATARSATAPGTYVKPSSGNAQDRGSIYECVTAGTGSAEPTWPSEDGEQVTDGSTVFEKVNVSKKAIGYEGVLLDAAVMTDGQEMYYIAILADEDVDHGDTDGWSSGVDQNA